MRRCREVFVGIDTAKARNAVAVAEAGRQGEVRYLGEFDNTPDAVAKLVRARRPLRDAAVLLRSRTHGLRLYRQILAMGRGCTVVAPSLTPRRPGERVKTNRRDALSLARRSGYLTRRTRRFAIWCAPARARSRITVASASSSARSCSGMAVFTKEARPGRGGICAGWTDRTRPCRPTARVPGNAERNASGR
jgi:transposase